MTQHADERSAKGQKVNFTGKGQVRQRGSDAFLSKGDQVRGKGNDDSTAKGKGRGSSAPMPDTPQIIKEDTIRKALNDVKNDLIAEYNKHRIELHFPTAHASPLEQVHAAVAHAKHLKALLMEAGSRKIDDVERVHFLVKNLTKLVGIVKATPPGLGRVGWIL